MRNRTLMGLVGLGLVGLALTTGAFANESSVPDSESAVSPTDGAAVFEQLKALVGEWQGEWEPGGAAMTVTYSLTGRGSVVVENYSREGETTMSTLYHLDGEELMLTHYCSAGNQPRMRATSVGSDLRNAVFDFIDVTSLAEGRGHSKRLELSFIDADHVSVHYTSSKTGQRGGIQLTRVQ